MEAVIVGGLLALTGLFLIISAVRDADFLYQPPVKATGKLIHGIVYKNFGKRGITQTVSSDRNSVLNPRFY